MASAWSQLIDPDVYPGPRDRAESIRLELQGQFAASARSYVMLPGFVTAAGCTALVREVDALLPDAHARDLKLRAYSDEVDDALPAAHPRRRRHRFCMRTIAYDRLGPDSLLAGLYHDDALTRAIAGVVGDPLYRCADPLLSCVVTAMTEGGEHGWHFDDNDLVASLLLVAPEAGGRYELVPDAADAPDLVARVMDGDRSPVVVPDMQVGTLTLSAGRRALHRVSPVESGRRVIALLSYHRRPGLQFADSVRIGVLGRAA